MSDPKLDQALTDVVTGALDSLLDEAISICEDVVQNTDIECVTVINKCGSTNRCNEAQRHLRKVKDDRTEQAALDLHDHINSSSMNRKCTEAVARQRIQRQKWARLLVVLAAIYAGSAYTNSSDFSQ